MLMHWTHLGRVGSNFWLCLVFLTEHRAKAGSSLRSRTPVAHLDAAQIAAGGAQDSRGGFSGAAALKLSLSKGRQTSPSALSQHTFAPTAFRLIPGELRGSFILENPYVKNCTHGHVFTSHSLSFQPSVF